MSTASPSACQRSRLNGNATAKTRLEKPLDAFQSLCTRLTMSAPCSATSQSICVG
jgi:hypothetical protein